MARAYSTVVVLVEYFDDSCWGIWPIWMNQVNEKCSTSSLCVWVRLCQGFLPSSSWSCPSDKQWTVRPQKHLWNSHRQTAFELDDQQWVSRNLPWIEAYFEHSKHKRSKSFYQTISETLYYTSRSESFYDHQWNLCVWTHSSRSMTIK